MKMHFLTFLPMLSILLLWGISRGSWALCRCNPVLYRKVAVIVGGLLLAMSVAGLIWSRVSFLYGMATVVIGLLLMAVWNGSRKPDRGTA